MQVGADSAAAKLRNSHQEHHSRAVALAQKKQWRAAIREMCAAVSLKPEYKNSKSNLLKWVQLSGNCPEAEDALRLIASKDRGYVGLQAVRQLHDWSGEAVTLEGRARNIRRRVEIKARELSLLHGSCAPEDRLELLAETERLDHCRTLLSELSTEARRKLSKRALLSVIRAFAKYRRAAELWHLSSRDELIQDPKVAAALAYAIATEGHCAEASELLSRFDKRVFTGRAFQALLNCADSRQDSEAAESVLREWLRYRPNDAFPHMRRLLDVGKRDPSALVAELNAQSAEIDFQPRDYVQLMECVIAKDPTAGLQIAQIGSDRFPADERLKAKLVQLSMRLADEELKQHERLKEQILNELSDDLIGAVGADQLVNCGGASRLHKILLESSVEAQGDDLIILAQLCLSAIRVILTRRDHKSRETAELQGPGYASWESLQQKYERLTTLTRTICLTALATGENDKRVFGILAQLQAMRLDDSEISRRLCNLALADAEVGVPLSVDVWTAALSCSDIELHVQFERTIAAMHGKVMRWADPSEGKGDAPQFQPIQSARNFVERVPVFGRGFDRDVAVTIDTRAEVITETTGITVYDGHLVSFDGESLWTLTSAGFVPPRRSSVLLYSGTRAAALKPSSSEIVIETPVLLIPGVPACFSQYFHFAGQMLPRILAGLQRLGPASSQMKIALPDFSAPFIYDMLQLCGIPRESVVAIPSSTTARFTNAFVTNPSLDDWQCAPEDLSHAREKLAAPKKSRSDRRIYLSRPLGSTRSRDRWITNEAELLDVAKDFHFEVVDPASMTQQDQRQLFSEAKILCGPVGAGLTNMLYMSDGGKVVSLGVSDVTVTIYPGLTLGQDIEFNWVFGRFDPALVHSRRFPHLPYSVNPLDFRRALESACA
jgi:hypothetical protein